MSNEPTSRPGSRRAEDLARIVDFLASTPAVRAELVADIRAQVEAGTYATEQKLNLAIYRMIRDILA